MIARCLLAAGTLAEADSESKRADDSGKQRTALCPLP